jgi:hypothetical protein
VGFWFERCVWRGGAWFRVFVAWVCGGLGLWLGAWAFVGLGHGLGLCVRHGTGRRYLLGRAAFGLLCWITFVDVCMADRV